MKIRKLKIRNYKIFDDVEFDFTDAEGNTLDTIVLAGVNGCGKTTVLELISKLNSGSWQQVIGEPEFDLSIWFVNVPNSLGITSSNTPPHINYNSKVGFRTSEPPLVEIVYFPVSLDKFKNNKTKTLHLSHQKDELKQLVLKNLRDDVFKNKDLPPKKIIESQIRNVTRTLSSLDLNTRLVDLESEELIFESANGQRIYFEQLSNGEQHLYFRAFYLSLLNLKDAVIMVDEPEAAFHPKWQQSIATLYQNVGENNQVLIATHSPHIMASVPPECLFMLHIDESDGKRKIRVINAAKAGKHSQGLEPDRILKEIMQVKSLRDYETQRDIDELSQLLTVGTFESKRAEELADKLTTQLGREDPFIILLEHELLMLRRKKRTPALATA